MTDRDELNGKAMLIENGELLRRIGKSRLAVHAFAKGARLCPEARWEFLYYMGSCAVDVGKWKQAARFYLQALRLNPECPDLWAGLAECAIEFRWFDEAVEMISHALRLDERCANAWVAWGDLHEARVDVEEAVNCYETALRVDPDCTRARARAGCTLRQLGLASGERAYFERAEAMFEAFLQHWPGDEAHLFNLGLTYGSLGRFQEAADTFAKIVELNPRDTEARKYRDLSLQDLVGSKGGANGEDRTSA